MRAVDWRATFGAFQVLGDFAAVSVGIVDMQRMCHCAQLLIEMLAAVGEALLSTALASLIDDCDDLCRH